MGLFIGNKSQGVHRQYVKSFIEQYDPIINIPTFVAPEIYEHNDQKLGAIISLISSNDIKGTKERIHLLYEGHPGCGKSEIMKWIAHNYPYNSCFISADPSTASLKGHGGLKDGGVKIFNRYSGGTVFIDDIELMKKTDDLRDVMESGKYNLSKGGRHEEFEAQCRIVAATNDVNNLSWPIKSRFDLAYSFKTPDVDASIGILQSILVNDSIKSIKDNPNIKTNFFIKYINVTQDFYPYINLNNKSISKIFDTIKSDGQGRSGRWLRSMVIVAKCIAKMYLSDVTDEHLLMAYEIKKQSDKVLYP